LAAPDSPPRFAPLRGLTFSARAFEVKVGDYERAYAAATGGRSK
jgi:hypothetical protein